MVHICGGELLLSLHYLRLHLMHLQQEPTHMKPPNYTEGLPEAEERLRIAGELSSARTAADIALVLNALNYYRSLAASQKSPGQKAFETRPNAWAGSSRAWDELSQFYRDAWETHATGTRKRYGMEGP